MENLTKERREKMKFTKENLISTSFMIIPYQSSYDPFIINCIKDYSYKPDKLEIVGPGKWITVGDKINDKFHENKNCKILIFHRAASLLNPGDLEQMVSMIDKNTLSVGIEPYFLEPGLRAPKMSDNKSYDGCGGVTVWNSKLYFELVNEAIHTCMFSRGSLIELFAHLGYLGNKKGYKNLQATKARIVYYD